MFTCFHGSEGSSLEGGDAFLVARLAVLASFGSPPPRLQRTAEVVAFGRPVVQRPAAAGSPRGLAVELKGTNRLHPR